MAQAILGGLGAAIGGPAGRLIGGLVGRSLDNALIAGLQPGRQGPRIDGLRLQSAAEGAGLAFAIGRNRVAGQVIWAARFRERAVESGGGKGGGDGRTDYAYSVSFAVALCEGPIDGVGRIWADNQPMDLSGVAMRIHRGTEDQAPDPLIAAVEGVAPAYRGVAYLVFEDLPLAAYGARPPMISAEVFRRPEGDGPRLEDRLEGVCLIPGAGEFVLASEPVARRTGLTTVASENVHAADGRPDLIVSLDQLEAQCPNLKRVSLVVGWFGDSLEAGACRIRPGVESLDKTTEPLVWSVAGLERHEAHLISQVDGRPAYGGTPSDATVRQAIRELKRRGWAVTLYPFIFMDCDGYPWRGRIAAGAPASAAAEVASFFDGDWGLRRLALHYARIAGEEGADGLLIGSELRGLTTSRDAGGGYPAVGRLRSLAAEARSLAGAGVAISYAADWSEYFGHQPDDGSGDRIFHLDPLWADPDIDHVAIDWYAPMGDWRDGEAHLDAQAGFSDPADPAYLRSQMTGGEGFDWYYASPAARTAQARTPIADTAHGEHWVFRPKDLRGWWSNPHHDRPGGVRSSEPTAWVPRMKPIRLTEFGCAAVHRGGNAPNLFQDPKSAEGALPPFSNGARDDRMQRRLLEAVLDWAADETANPASPVYGGPMVEAADAWCWDARPYPAFPALSDIWADASAWASGHWLTGRLNGETADLIRAVLARGGVEGEAVSIEPLDEAASGLVVSTPTRLREALEPLLLATDARLAERDGRVAVLGPAVSSGLLLSADRLAQDEPEDAPRRDDREPAAAIASAQVRFIDEGRAYQTGAALAVRAGDGPRAAVDMAVTCFAASADAAARRALRDLDAIEGVSANLGPLESLRLEPGDGVQVEGRDGLWRVTEVRAEESSRATLEPAPGLIVAGPPEPPGPEAPPQAYGRPFVAVLDLPPLPGAESDARPLVAVARTPWTPMDVWAGADAAGLSLRARAESSATVGRLTAPTPPGPRHRWQDSGEIRLSIEGEAPESRSRERVLAGEALLAIETEAGWELVQYRDAEMIGGGEWRLTGLLRGVMGTEDAMEAGAQTGAVVAVVEGLARMDVALGERGLPLTVRAGPAGRPPGPDAGEVMTTWLGVQSRPWRPAHLKLRPEAEGLRLSWTPRVRIGGDDWRLEPAGVEGTERFRVRIMAGETVVRTAETAERSWLYPADAVAGDQGVHANLTLNVAQYGAGYGWGSEARRTI